jgi:acetyl esterase/lipase
LRDEGQAYADRLSQAGVKVKYTCHAGMIHLFYGMASVIPYARTAMAQIGAELRVVLG